MDRLLNVKRAKRQRYLELAGIANEVCALLEDKGVTQDEGCIVRRQAEEMWNAARHLSMENALREPTAYVGTANVTSGPESDVTCEVDPSC